MQIEELLMATYKSSNFTTGCLEIRLFYVRTTSCAVDVVPDHLVLRHLRREMGVSLESRIPPSDAVSVMLRRDKVDKGSSEVTYVSTDNVRVSGSVEFVVHEEKEGLILCGPLERVEGTWDNGNGTVWSMDCYNVESFGSGGSVFFQPKIGVYVAGCCSGVPLILTKTIQVSPRRKLYRHGMLDVIPEDEGVGKEDQYVNGFIPQRKLPITDSELDDYESEGIAGHDFYLDNMYLGEDGQLSWFNARVRVGVGIGLGMCVGVGIGVVLLVHSYQATTRNLWRRFF